MLGGRRILLSDDAIDPKTIEQQGHRETNRTTPNDEDRGLVNSLLSHFSPSFFAIL
jgi:hypothetical protein